MKQGFLKLLALLMVISLVLSGCGNSGSNAQAQTSVQVQKHGQGSLADFPMAELKLGMTKEEVHHYLDVEFRELDVSKFNIYATCETFHGSFDFGDSGFKDSSGESRLWVEYMIMYFNDIVCEVAISYSIQETTAGKNIEDVRTLSTVMKDYWTRLYGEPDRSADLYSSSLWVINDEKPWHVSQSLFSGEPSENIPAFLKYTLTVAYEESVERQILSEK